MSNQRYSASETFNIPEVVSPAFSAEKALAIRELSHKLLARTYIQCRQRFWVDQGLSGYASTDLPKTYFSESTVGQPGIRGFLYGT
jgi:monoamine oxidase